jgi:hypothetical protein
MFHVVVPCRNPWSQRGISLPPRPIRNCCEALIYEIQYLSNPEQVNQSTRRTARRGEVHSTAASPLPNATRESGQEQGKTGYMPLKYCLKSNLHIKIVLQQGKDIFPILSVAFCLHSHRFHRGRFLDAVPGGLNAHSFVWHKR